MKISEIVQHPMTATYEVGSGLPLTWDANKFTAALGRRMAALYRERSEQARLDKQESAQGAAAERADSMLSKRVDAIAERLELNAQIEEFEKEIYADALACDRFGILIEWDLRDDEDKPTRPTFDVLMRLPASFIGDLYSFTRDGALPKKSGPTSGTARTETTEETSSPTSDGSLRHHFGG